MAKCQDITPRKKTICVEALKYKIGIYDRNVVGIQTNGNAAHQEIYTFVKFVKAAIETRKAQVLQTLDGVVIDPDLIITHTFITRFTTGITTEQFIQFKSLNYKILKVDNIDEADQWFRISAGLRGDATKAGAQ